ncbi:MAG TPA: ABC transporter substrate-binding protein, partial [Pyrinomonadaceae bacterium]|nr:ABC transporter substrate-binding protein [Pyrinomonadaceae bacterium]
MIRRLVFLVLLILLSFGLASAQTPLTPPESRGKEIYLLGASKSGKDILAYIGDSSLEVPGSSMACANCHGIAGHGKPEGGIDPSNITWEALTKPYGVTHSSGRKHPAYTPRGLELAITRGVDPAGNKLLNAMPRYQMSKEDLHDLIVYLKRLGTDLDPGISENQIVIGTTLPATGPLAEMGEAVKAVLNAYLAEVNLQGGIYNRRLELKVSDTGRANIERLINDEKVFAMTNAFLAGGERELIPVFAQFEVPLVGPMTLNPQPGTPLNRQIFYVLSGNSGQARALISFLKKRGDLKDGKLAVMYHRGELNASIVEGIKQESEKTTVYEYTAANLDAAEYVKQMRQNESTAVFFLGSSQDTLAFMTEAAKVNWFPQILLQSGGAIFDAPAGFDGKIFMTVPTSPADQTADALQEFRALAEKYKLPQKHLAAQIAACSSAKVLVEALKRVGKDLSREKLIQTLEGFYEFPTGLTPVVTFGPNRRIGAMGAYVLTIDLKEKKFK